MAQTPTTVTAPKLINLDTTAIPPLNSAWARADVRVFGSSEKTTYGGLEVGAGLAKGLGLILRGAAGQFSDFPQPGFTIRHGGSDIEAMLKYSPPELNGLSLSAGVSQPNTPAQKNAFFTGEALYRLPITGADVYLGAKGAFRNNSSIVGISGGFSAHAAPGLDFIGDVTGIITGNNTFSTSTGNKLRRAVYGLGLRFSTFVVPKQSLTFEAGITNGIGNTTGFSLTPALGNTIGFYLSAGMKF
jgi:hypothetical protein